MKSSSTSKATAEIVSIFSIYDEEGVVSEDAEKIIDQVFPDYPASSERMSAVRKTIWDSLHGNDLNKTEFTKHCEQVRKFSWDKEGSIPFASDPKAQLFTAWIKLFRTEMNSVPHDKSAQTEWKATYGNFFWVAGWALMQLKEEDRDFSGIHWQGLTGNELIELASEFANYIYSEDLEPLLVSIKE